MKNIAIFASGTGTNAEKIMDRFKAHPQIRVSLLVCNKPHAPVLDIARRFGVKTLLINRDDFYGSRSLAEDLEKADIVFIVLAGFLWLIPPYLVEAYPNRIINIHPALLPRYGGKGMYGNKVHQAVKSAGDTRSGITVHYVNEAYDEGHIIFQTTCPVTPDDTPEDIAAKVHQLEYAHYPEIIESLVQKIDHSSNG